MVVSDGEDDSDDHDIMGGLDNMDVESEALDEAENTGVNIADPEEITEVNIPDPQDKWMDTISTMDEPNLTHTGIT